MRYFFYPTIEKWLEVFKKPPLPTSSKTALLDVREINIDVKNMKIWRWGDTHCNEASQCHVDYVSLFMTILELLLDLRVVGLWDSRLSWVTVIQRMTLEDLNKQCDNLLGS